MLTLADDEEGTPTSNFLVDWHTKQQLYDLWPSYRQQLVYFVPVCNTENIVVVLAYINYYRWRGCQLTEGTSP